MIDTDQSRCSARCWRRSSTRRSTTRGSSTNRSTTASARSSKCPHGQPVRLWSRLGNEKTGSFRRLPALERWASRRKLTAPVVLDGEIVALDARRPPRRLPAVAGTDPHRRLDTAPARGKHASRGQRPRPRLWRSRLHRLRSAARRRDRPARSSAHRATRGARAAVPPHGIAAPAPERAGSRRRPCPVRAGAARAAGKASSPSAATRATSRASARPTGASSRSSTSRSSSSAAGPNRGRRAPTSARCCSASTAGRVDARRPAHRLTYVGHVGTGFDERELARVMALLKPLETRRRRPFASRRPDATSAPHWVEPDARRAGEVHRVDGDGMLRHPVYLGLRDDKKADDVVREKTTRHASPASGSGRRRRRLQ